MEGTDALALICIFGLPVGAWIVSRVLKHRERMAYIERGMMPPSSSRDFGRKRNDQWNATPYAAAPPPPPFVPYDNTDVQCSLHRGIKTAMVGVALVLGLSLIGYHGSEDGVRAHVTPGPWLLGGLVPMFVGISQIIIAVLSGARLPGFTTIVQQQPPPNIPQPPPSYTSRSPFNDDVPPYPSRPGVTYEELARPVKPPDVR